MKTPLTLPPPTYSGVYILKSTQITLGIMLVVIFVSETIKIDFGRSPEWNCPIPDTDAKSDAVRHDVTTVPTVLSDITTGQSLAKEVCKKKYQYFVGKNIFKITLHLYNDETRSNILGGDRACSPTNKYS